MKTAVILQMCFLIAVQGGDRHVNSVRRVQAGDDFFTPNPTPQPADDYYTPSPAPQPGVVTGSNCDANGGTCTCAKDGNGMPITVNFYGDTTDEKVYGCGGAFSLSGADLTATVEGEVPGGSAGISFLSQDSYYGWEGCCTLCGEILQANGKISSGWQCNKDFFATGIWLVGINA